MHNLGSQFSGAPGGRLEKQPGQTFSAMLGMYQKVKQDTTGNQF
jgi:hypothetical protein